MKKIIIFFILLFWNYFYINFCYSKTLEECDWNNREGKPCLTISKVSNSSTFTKDSINKTIITKQDIINSGADDVNDILKLIPGLDVFQSGPKGQSTSVFTRGSESNHTLVLLNGIAINDQSVTDGLHDFGQDFIQTIQQIEIFKGSNGVHFGPSAIAGAVNFITDIDYTNNFSVSGFNNKNNSINGSYTKVIDNGWHLNFKATSTKGKTNSTIAKGEEDDGFKNQQINLNGTKWIKNNLKFKSTFYSRKTKADYDGSANDEIGYVSDNRMYSFQSGFERKSKNSLNEIIFHYHNYDREYENGGYLDEYYSEAFVIKGENKIKKSDRFSFGFGSEYKYDWGNFENRGSYSASTKGHNKNLGIFGNAGYKFNNNQILSMHIRSDNNKTTNSNQTYKINFFQILGKFKLGATHSTGLRNPTLYELYGTDNYGIKGNVNLNPEKSKTNELSLNYGLSKNLNIKSTVYRTTIFDQIETNSSYTQHENMKIDINQEGLENELSLTKNSQSFSLFSNFSKSKKTNGQSQSRRPDLSYGVNYFKKIKKSPFGDLNFNLNYKYTGKYIDWDGAKNSSQKSTDILNVSINKVFFGTNLKLIISNLLDENYEKPATYSQNGRQIRFGIFKEY
tara:strand:- start:2781 stop:4646 length:1866 start_codon:yes stop_codon:yes gene_type:complete